MNYSNENLSFILIQFLNNIINKNSELKNNFYNYFIQNYKNNKIINIMIFILGLKINKIYISQKIILKENNKEGYIIGYTNKNNFDINDFHFNIKTKYIIVLKENLNNFYTMNNINFLILNDNNFYLPENNLNFFNNEENNNIIKLLFSNIDNYDVTTKYLIYNYIYKIKKIILNKFSKKYYIIYFTSIIHIYFQYFQFKQYLHYLF